VKFFKDSFQVLQIQVIRERKLELKQLLEHDNNNNDELNVDDISRIAAIRRERGQWLDFLDILLLTRVQ